MSKETYLSDMTTSSGYLATKTVYFNDVITKKLNGMPLTTLKKEGNDQLAPIDYNTVYNVAQGCKGYNSDKDNLKHDYQYYLDNMDIESKGLPGTSTNPVFKNSAIGSRAGGVFGNQIDVISSETRERSVITPFTVSSNVVLTDELYGSSGEPSTKKIKVQSDIEMNDEKSITFGEAKSDSKTIINKGSVVVNQIGNEETSLKICANGVQVESDLEMGDTKRIITSQIQSDDLGILDIKANKIHFAANEITFDPETTEITTGNFPQVISNLADYETFQKATVYTYTEPSLKGNVKAALYSALWRLQMFYNLIVVKLKFDMLTNEEDYKAKMNGVETKDIYIQFPIDYYSHFCDYYGKSDEDYYITDTELIMQKEGEEKKLNISVYFNPTINNFLKLRFYDWEGKAQIWPTSFFGYKTMRLKDITFNLGVSIPRLKKQYVSTTPSTFMKKPDYFETITPRKKIKIARLKGTDIYKDNIQQSIYITNDLPSDYELQAAVNATKIHKIAFFEVRFTFVNKSSGNPVPINDVLKVLKGYDKNPTQFMITFIPAGENRRFACSDQSNSDHIAVHPVSNVKFIYNPKADMGLTKGLLDFSDAKEVPNDDEVSMGLQFFHITEN